MIVSDNPEESPQFYFPGVPDFFKHKENNDTHNNRKYDTPKIKTATAPDFK
jgi:hypothetical protein